jgi:hypothetical protein
VVEDEVVERLAGKAGTGIDGAGGHGYEAAAPVGATGISVAVCSVTAYQLQGHMGRCEWQRQAVHSSSTALF